MFVPSQRDMINYHKLHKLKTIFYEKLFKNDFIEVQYLSLQLIRLKASCLVTCFSQAKQNFYDRDFFNFNLKFHV